jgi:hypothetical protein
LGIVEVATRKAVGRGERMEVDGKEEKSEE